MSNITIQSDLTNKTYTLSLNDSLEVNSFASSRKFAKTDTYDASTAKYKSSTIQTALNNNKLSNIAALDGALIDWDNINITINGVNKNINSTADLIAAIELANKTYPIGNYNGKLDSKSFYDKYNDLSERIDNLILSYNGL